MKTERSRLQTRKEAKRKKVWKHILASSAYFLFIPPKDPEKTSSRLKVQWCLSDSAATKTSARADCRPYDRVTARSWRLRRFPRTLLTWQRLTDLAALSRETLRTVAAIAVTFLQTAPSVETGVSLARVLLHCKHKQSGTLLNE